MDPAGRDKPKKNILRDDNDNPITDKVTGSVIEIPPGEDPHFFVDQGLLHRWYMGGIPTPEELHRMARLLMSLFNFQQGGAWDAQRIEGRNMHEFVAYATLAIGLYGAAAGIPMDVMLEIENLYARFSSRFGEKVEKDKVYTRLPETNVENTKLGYELFESGRIGPSRK
ncbi:MAG: hypothetical protein ACHQF3_07255 [Alphaproteobacteria bacterium]